MVTLLLALAGCNTDVGITESSACDGQVQAGEATVDAPFDRDGDGYFDGNNVDCQAAYSADSLDCDDAQIDVNPGEVEVECDGIDQDCDEEGTPDGLDDVSCVDDFSGSWTFETPPITYQCAFSFGSYLVDVNFFSLAVLDTGAQITMQSTGGQPGSMSGTRNAEGAFTVARTISGLCTETYGVTGSFVDADTMDGTFTASFSGSGCSDCTTQTRPLTAIRD